MKNWAERVWRGDKGEVCETIDGRWQTTPIVSQRICELLGRVEKLVNDRVG
jgi:hypothetical protein